MDDLDGLGLKHAMCNIRVSYKFVPLASIMFLANTPYLYA